MNRQRRHRLRDGYDQRIAVFLAGMLFALALMSPQVQRASEIIMQQVRAFGAEFSHAG